MAGLCSHFISPQYNRGCVAISALSEMVGAVGASNSAATQNGGEAVVVQSAVRGTIPHFVENVM